MQTTFEELLSHDNTVRVRAEDMIKQEHASNPAALATNLISGLVSEKTEVATICCVLIKKYFLDSRATSSLADSDLESLRAAVLSSIEFEKQPLNLLKRKGDVLIKIYAKLNKHQELLAYLVTLVDSDNIKSRQFAMYGFEIISEVHLSAEQLTQNKGDFMRIFEKTLQDNEVTVRVAALKAVTAFVGWIEDQDTVMGFAPVLPTLLNTVVEALQNDEEQGTQALGSLGELTSAHPEVWKGHMSQLLNVASQVLNHKDFEDGTRAAAAELILSLSEQMPAALRKAEETKTLFYPSLVKMLTEVDEDDAAWAENQDTFDVDHLHGTDAVSTAMSTISRITEDLGEKTTIAATTPVLGELIAAGATWQQKQAGYLLIGLTAKATSGSLLKTKETILEPVRAVIAAVQDTNTRIRFAGYEAMRMLFEHLAPKVQIHSHDQMFEFLVGAMLKEDLLKVQAKGCSALLAYIDGFNQEEDEEDDSFNSQEIMEKYSGPLLQALVQVLRKAIQQNYEPLQQESLKLISSVAQTIGSDFSNYYNEFMPLMTEVLQNVKNETMAEKKLRAMAIETIGSIFAAISDLDDKEAHKASVMAVTTELANMIAARLSDDDPQDEAIKDALTQSAGYLGAEFNQFMPMLLDQLITDAKLNLDFKMENADMPSTSNPKNM